MAGTTSDRPSPRRRAIRLIDHHVDGVAAEHRHAAIRYLGAEPGNAWRDQLPDDIAMTRISLEPNWVGLIDLTDHRRLPSAFAD